MVAPAALVGLHVVDASTNLAGPVAAMVLGDLGADVVKVERPPYGDDARLLPPLVDDRSAVFLAVNGGKRSVVLDLREADARQAYLRLVARADVVVDSFGPGVAERLGVGAADLAAVNDRVVHCSVSAFGGGVLGAALPGYDGLVQAVSGMMRTTGEPGGPPVRVGPSAIDLSTGLWAVINVLVALGERERRTGPQRIEAVLVDSAFFLLAHQVVETLLTGTAPGPHGSAARSAAPNEAFRTADGWVLIATGNDRQFGALAAALELPALVDEPRFATVADRVAVRAVLHATLEARTAAWPTAEVLARLGAAGVPAGPVRDLAEALGDPLTAERGILASTTDDEVPALRLPLAGRVPGVRTPAPHLGAHTAEVLAELGCPDRVVRRLARVDEA